MSYDAEKVAVATKSLQDAAAAALAAVESGAAPQKVWSLLTPKTQSVLRDLCAAQYSLPPPATTLASLRMPRRGLVALSEDVLGSIIAFVDLPMRFTCVAACDTLRDACARQSPRLEHSLVVKRFPLLRSFSNIRTAPRELFRTFKQFESEDAGFGGSRRPASSIALDAYQLSLVITAREVEYITGGGWRFMGPQEVICVGTGELQSEAAPRVVYKFTIPAAAYERASQLEEEPWRLIATVVASRRDASGRLQFAKLLHEECGLDEDEEFDFDAGEIPSRAGTNPTLNFYKWKTDSVDMYTDPQLKLSDELDMTTRRRWIRATFRWQLGPTPIEEDFMTEQEARCCLEHYAAWSD